MGSLSLLQRIFPTQEWNWGLLHCRWILYQLSYQGSPRVSKHLLIAKYRLKFKKVGKTTGPFKYDLTKPLGLYNGSDKQIQRIESDKGPEELLTEAHDIV